MCYRTNSSCLGLHFIPSLLHPLAMMLEQVLSLLAMTLTIWLLLVLAMILARQLCCQWTTGVSGQQVCYIYHLPTTQ